VIPKVLLCRWLVNGAWPENHLSGLKRQAETRAQLGILPCGESSGLVGASPFSCCVSAVGSCAGLSTCGRAQAKAWGGSRSPHRLGVLQGRATYSRAAPELTSPSVGRGVPAEPSLSSRLCRWGESSSMSRPGAHASVGGVSVFASRPPAQISVGGATSVLASRAVGWSRGSGLGSAGTPRPTIGPNAVDAQVGRIVLDEPSRSSRLCRWGERTREPTPSPDLRRWGNERTREPRWRLESGFWSRLGRDASPYHRAKRRRRAGRANRPR
jgi:hypothetical protein